MNHGSCASVKSFALKRKWIEVALSNYGPVQIHPPRSMCFPQAPWLSPPVPELCAQGLHWVHTLPCPYVGRLEVTDNCFPWQHFPTTLLPCGMFEAMLPWFLQCSRALLISGFHSSKWLYLPYLNSSSPVRTLPSNMYLPFQSLLLRSENW